LKASPQTDHPHSGIARRANFQRGWKDMRALRAGLGLEQTNRSQLEREIPLYEKHTETTTMREGRTANYSIGNSSGRRYRALRRYLKQVSANPARFGLRIDKGNACLVSETAPSSNCGLIPNVATSDRTRKLQQGGRIAEMQAVKGPVMGIHTREAVNIFFVRPPPPGQAIADMLRKTHQPRLASKSLRATGSPDRDGSASGFAVALRPGSPSKSRGTTFVVKGGTGRILRRPGGGQGGCGECDQRACSVQRAASITEGTCDRELAWRWKKTGGSPN